MKIEMLKRVKLLVTAFRALYPGDRSFISHMVGMQMSKASSVGISAS